MSVEVACVEGSVERTRIQSVTAPSGRTPHPVIQHRVRHRHMRRARDRSRFLPIPAAAAASLYSGIFSLSLVWQDRYRVHVAHLDRQHRRIVTILNRAQYLEADDRRGVETVLNVLVASMRRHFADEEDLLASHGYPGWGRQTREHERCLGVLYGYQVRLRDGRVDEMVAAFEWVGDWFARHLEISDKAYEPFLRACGCR